MNDNFNVYMKYRQEFEKFESYYFDAKNLAAKETDLSIKIEILAELVAKTKEFEVFCKQIGLSKDFNELYKKAFNSKGLRNLIQEDKDELKRCKLLQKLIKKINRLDFNTMQEIDNQINHLREESK